MHHLEVNVHTFIFRNFDIFINFNKIENMIFIYKKIQFLFHLYFTYKNPFSDVYNMTFSKKKKNQQTQPHHLLNTSNNSTPQTPTTKQLQKPKLSPLKGRIASIARQINRRLCLRKLSAINQDGRGRAGSWTSWKLARLRVRPFPVVVRLMFQDCAENRALSSWENIDRAYYGMVSDVWKFPLGEIVFFRMSRMSGCVVIFLFIYISTVDK